MPLPVLQVGNCNQLFSQSQSPRISHKMPFAGNCPFSLALPLSLFFHGAPSCLVEGWACVDGRVKSCISDFTACGRRAFFSFPCAKTNSILRFFQCLYILLSSKCYAMDCFSTHLTHVQTCDVARVQSATQWTASVHTLHMSKPVM